MSTERLAESAESANKVIALEEHFASKAVIDAWRRLDRDDRDLSFAASTLGETGRRLLEVGEERLAVMDADGVDVQIVSHTAPGVQNLSRVDATALQRHANDELADWVAQNPARFGAFATLATPDPGAAAKELERAIQQLGFQGAILYGRTGAQYLDHQKYWPIFEAAEHLGVPVYLHPQSPQRVVQSALYSGISLEVDAGLATHGIGWHYETGIQLFRLMLAGVFDRFPKLKIIVGHWGEVVLFFLERMEHIGAAAGLPHSLHEYARRNVFITPSGMLSERYLRWTIDVVGVERIMLSTDYPFHTGNVRPFLDNAALTVGDRAKISSGNWTQLVNGIGR